MVPDCIQAAIFYWCGPQETTRGEALLPVETSYAEVYARFRWHRHIPTNFNMGVDVGDRRADDPSRLAMIYEDDPGRVSTHTFAEFRARSTQLVHALIRLDITRGDRVGIILSQHPETAVVHLAAYKLGALVLPLLALFGQEALDYRLRDAGAWMEQLEHGLTPPFGSSYAGRPTSRGPWWSATRHKEPILSGRPWPPGRRAAAARAGQRLASCSGAAPGGAARKGHALARAPAGAGWHRVGGHGRWKRHGGKGCLNP